MQLPNTTQLFLEVLEALVPALPHPAPCPPPSTLYLNCAASKPLRQQLLQRLRRLVLKSMGQHPRKELQGMQRSAGGEDLAPGRSPTLSTSCSIPEKTQFPLAVRPEGREDAVGKGNKESGPVVPGTACLVGSLIIPIL